jgi:endonuclease/exonuclease/phosphatase family metal-dependent hydrolase
MALWLMKQYSIRFLLFIFTLLIISCQKNQNRLGMPENFTATISDTITLVSYNVENFFDMVDNGTEYREYKPGNCNWTNSTFQKKTDNIASVLKAINADIAILVEVENENAVTALLSALREKKGFYPYYALGVKAGRSSTMPVMLSKYPVLLEKCLAVEGDGSLYNRNMLEADIFLGRDTLSVFACHWPSKLHKESSRLACAKILAKRLGELSQRRDIIIAGDFNADYDECETFHTSGLDDTKGVTGINHVLKTVVSQPDRFVVSTSKQGLAAGVMQGLYDAWLDVPETRRFSAMFKGRPQTPDHILLPASMFDGAGISYVNNSFAPFTWNGRLLKNGAPYRWQMRYSKQGKFHVGDGFSDHLPLVAKLRRGSYSPNGFDASANIGHERAPKGEPGGFEDGADGWIACANQVKVVRDTLHPQTGRYCLFLSGKTKENASAARCRMGVPTGCGGEKGALSMSLKGKGSLCLRVKSAEEKKWVYFKGRDFVSAKASRFFDYNFEKWTTISLPLSVVADAQKEIDVEIRTKKGEEIRVFVDDVKITCGKK